MLGEKGRDLTQSYDKSPYTHRKTQKATWQHTNATEIFDFTTIAEVWISPHNLVSQSAML